MADEITVEVPLPDEAATARLGAVLAERARPGDILALTGPLGSGKTVFARGFIRALTDPEEEVPSPTFTLAQSYDYDNITIWHFDLYRLEDPSDAVELGIEEAFFEAICLVEWPERLGAMLPARRLSIRFAPAGVGRLAVIRASGDWVERVEGL